MSKETITYTENNFEPLNKAIDQSIKEQGLEQFGVMLK